MKYLLKKTMLFVLMLLFYYPSSAQTTSTEPITADDCLALKESPTNIGELESCVEDWAYENKHRGVHYKYVVDKGVQLLFKAVRMGDKYAVEELLYDSGYIELTEETNEEGQNPLMVAIMHRHADIAIFLIEESGDVYHRDPSGRDPLMYAVWFIQPDVVEALLNEDPRLINNKDYYGWNAFSLLAHLQEDPETTDRERRSLDEIEARLTRAKERIGARNKN